MTEHEMGVAALAVTDHDGGSQYLRGQLEGADSSHGSHVVVLQIETLGQSLRLVFRRGEFSQMLASGAAIDVAVAITRTEEVDEPEPERSAHDDRDAWEYPGEAEAGTPVEDPA